jgi:fumarate hydratase class II
LAPSSPRCGIGEIGLPDTQPGSSIMPGKVNPVICESVLQVAAHVIGCDATIAMCGQSGNFELNDDADPRAQVDGNHRIHDQRRRSAPSKCVIGIEANEQRCRELVELSLAMVTALAPVIGYDAAAKIAQEAVASGKTVREIATARGIVAQERLNAILDSRRMTVPGSAD